jgi:hypothetical protein
MRPCLSWGRIVCPRRRGRHVVVVWLTRFTPASACALLPIRSPPIRECESRSRISDESGEPAPQIDSLGKVRVGSPRELKIVLFFFPNFSAFDDARSHPKASSLGFSGAWRIGEAANPGPAGAKLVVTSVNLTSVSKRIGDFNYITKGTHA